MFNRPPTINETVAALRQHFANGARGPSEAPQNMGLESRRTLAGGRGAGLAGNPAASGGGSPYRGTGPGLVPNTGMPTLQGAQHHAMRIGAVNRAVAAGHLDPAHGAKLNSESQAYIDRHASMKRAAAVRASKPKRGPSFGSLSDGSDDVNQTSLLTDGMQSDVPGGRGVGTTRSPFNQGNPSGGNSQVPNASFSHGSKRGPGYGW
jgi:hypothetical protein